MGRRLTPEEKVLREQRAPLVGAVVAYGTVADGYKIGRVIDIDVDLDDDEPIITLTLANAAVGTRWLVFWDPMNVSPIPMLHPSLERQEA